MHLSIWGGAGEHGRSCYLLEDGDCRILLDCGVKKDDAGTYPLLSEAIIPKLDAVFLSHAHDDHSMALPLLYKLGYTGPIWTTKATARILPAYHKAWRLHEESRCAAVPYGRQDFLHMKYAYLEEASGPGEWLQLLPSLRVMWGRSGHMIGSVWLLLELNGKLAFYSGDFTTESGLLAADWPDLAAIDGREQVELSIVDAAYGIDTKEQADCLQELEACVRQVTEQGGTILLPVPASGRSQDMLVWLRESFPLLPVIVEPGIMETLEGMVASPEWLKEGADHRIQRVLADEGILVPRNEEHRRELWEEHPVCAVLTSDGMMESASARLYYGWLAERAGSSVVLSGHLSSDCLGRRLLEAAPEERYCDVRFIRYKVHQGLPDVRRLLTAVSARHTLLVHTGLPASEALCTILGQEGWSGLHALQAGDRLVIQES